MNELPFKVMPKGSMMKYGGHMVDRNLQNHKDLVTLLKSLRIQKGEKKYYSLDAEFSGDYRAGGNDIDKLLRNLLDALTKASIIWDDSYIKEVRAVRVKGKDSVKFELKEVTE